MPWAWRARASPSHQVPRRRRRWQCHPRPRPTRRTRARSLSWPLPPADAARAHESRSTRLSTPVPPCATPWGRPVTACATSGHGSWGGGGTRSWTERVAEERMAEWGRGTRRVAVARRGIAEGLRRALRGRGENRLGFLGRGGGLSGGGGTKVHAMGWLGVRCCRGFFSVAGVVVCAFVIACRFRVTLDPLPY